MVCHFFLLSLNGWHYIKKIKGLNLLSPLAERSLRWQGSGLLGICVDSEEDLLSKTMFSHKNLFFKVLLEYSLSSHCCFALVDANLSDYH